MKKKYQNIQINADELKTDIKRRKDFIVEQERQIWIMNKEKEINKKEVKERDRTIGDKERRIFDLKKKNAELEKFKFVLDYKIKELKREIIPREEEISKMKE
jgi:chromosome segregation ATPase